MIQRAPAEKAFVTLGVQILPWLGFNFLTFIIAQIPGP